MTLITDKNSLTDKLATEGGVALFIGDTGIGKTSLCREIGEKLTAQGIKCGYVDGDINSGSLSGIGIMGMCVWDSPKSVAENKILKEYFVGAVTNAGHGIDIIFGISRLIREAKRAGCQAVLVDTLGEYDYPTSVIFTQNLIESLYPDYVVGLQTAHETEFALCPFLKREDINIAILEKDPPVLNLNRLELDRKFSIAGLFRDSRSHLVMMSEVSFLNTWLRNGRQLKWQYFRTLSNILKSRVYHVEIAYKTLFIFTDGTADDYMRSEIREYLHVKDIVIRPPDVYANLYVGFLSANNVHIGVGLIENIDFEKNIMSVRSSIKSFEPVKQIKFGFIKTVPTGDFIEKI